MPEFYDTGETVWNTEHYQLVDFGRGRKLERFGRRLVDRPCPAAAAQAKLRTDDWNKADVIIDEDSHKQSQSLKLASQEDPWQVAHRNVVFNLKITPFGHVGLFPEQIHNWNWLETQLAQRDLSGEPPVALNLFAYTGGTTLALASQGARVVHVDASAPAVNWARQNAGASGMNDRPIRWLTEDARKFVSRELRRGNKYDIVVLDPPSYGHGPTGKRWEIGVHLPDLLHECIDLLTKDGRSLLLVSAHCESPSMIDIADLVAKTSPLECNYGRLSLLDRQGRSLDAGFYVRSRF